MSQKMNEAVEFLKTLGYKIIVKGDGFLLHGGEGEGIFYSKREVYKLAKDAGKKIGNKWVKKYTGGVDRTAARDAIKTEQFDKIPTMKRITGEDPWAWD